MKFLTFDVTNGLTKFVDFLTQSSGATDANKPIQTDASGKIDATLMPTGVGADTASLPATEALSAGNYVNIYDVVGTKSVRKADASVTGKEANGFVQAAAANGTSAIVYFSGRNTSLTGLIANKRYFLSATTPGAVTDVPPTTTGSIIQSLGVANDTTSLPTRISTPIVNG